MHKSHMHMLYHGIVDNDTCTYMYNVHLILCYNVIDFGTYT